MHYSKQAQAAKLNKRITFQKFSLEKNKNDVQVKVWKDFYPCWASVENLYGNEFFQAQQNNAEKTVKFTIRFNKNIDETMRIKFGKKLVNGAEVDRVFEIKFSDNMKYDNEFMEIKALEVVKGG